VNDALPPRRWIVRGVVALLVVSLFAPAIGTALTGGAGEPGELSPGTIEREPPNDTVVSIQGFHFDGQGNSKKPARLVSAAPDGRTNWVFDGDNVGATWFYDVDPLPNGNLLVSTTRNPDTHANGTLVVEVDPDTQEAVWSQGLEMTDTHDVDRINDTHIVVANMRNYDEETGVSNDRIVIYDTVDDEVDWEWKFRNHYPNSTDGGFSEDWTHVNDVDVIDEHRLLLSPRNFDQAVILNRTTGEIEDRLGSDGDLDVLNEQHNPDYMVSDDGNPVILVADSENDRVVEYERIDGEWERTWTVGEGQLNWPRDADRLPNGNTLIVDSLNHRVIEVTPTGEIVWEYYATWAPYDAERIGTGDESVQDGPTMREAGHTGEYTLTGSAGLIDGSSVGNWLVAVTEGTPLESVGAEAGTTYNHVSPWIKPVWMTDWDLAYAAVGLLVSLGWAGAEAVYQRRRLAAGVRSAVARVA